MNMTGNTGQSNVSYDRLRHATSAVFVATIYLFMLRTYGTAVADMFNSYVAVQVTQILALIASSTYVVFFYLFYKDYAEEAQHLLKKAALGAFIGNGLILILQLRSLCFILRFYDHVLMDLEYIVILLPLAGSLSMVIFFTVFRKEVKRQNHAQLKIPTLAGLIGADIQLCFALLMAANYLAVEQGVFLPDRHRIVWIVLMPILMLQFMAYLYFYISFRRVLKQYTPTEKVYNPIIEE